MPLIFFTLYFSFAPVYKTCYSLGMTNFWIKEAKTLTIPSHWVGVTILGTAVIGRIIRVRL